MSAWRRVALEKLPPEFRWTIEHAETPVMLWVDLWSDFHSAYTGEGNERVIAAIYDYADWCLQQTGSPAQSAAAIGFYENLPIVPAAMKDLLRRISLEQFNDFWDFFHYHLDEKQHADLVRDFYREKGEPPPPRGWAPPHSFAARRQREHQAAHRSAHPASPRRRRNRVQARPHSGAPPDLPKRRREI